MAQGCPAHTAGLYLDSISTLAATRVISGPANLNTDKAVVLSCAHAPVAQVSINANMATLLKTIKRFLKKGINGCVSGRVRG